MSSPPERNSAASRTAGPESAWGPLQYPVFRMLWVVWIAANICMWMNDVAAAWMMTSLSPSPMMVALVQSASTLPVFLLGLPSGALADILDRRRYFIFTQIWVATVASIICAVILLGWMSAPLLLALTFANGMGLAMRWPVFAAVVPELVPRAQLPGALALNGIAMNASRIIGPILAGAIIAAAGSHFVFVLNAVISLVAAVMIRSWKREAKVSALPAERFLGAIRAGVQHVRQSKPMHVILLRVSVFFVQSMALLALLPLIAKGLHGQGAASFTLLMAAMGGGAIVAVIFLPRIRQRLDRNGLVHHGTWVHAIAMSAVALAPNVYVAAPAMMVAGMAWIAVANSLTVAAQLVLPDWVRARGMSIFQMSMMGASAIGAALWGQVATWTDVRTSLVCASVGALVFMLLLRRLRLEGLPDEHLTPAEAIHPPSVGQSEDLLGGPLLITVEYRIDPARTREFIEVMQISRRNRLSQGVLSWSLFHLTTDPAIYIEHFIDESWAEHLRHFERLTAFDIALRDRRLAFHLGDEPPKVSRYLAQALKV
ncbi:MFS transporter [soil metagenome]